MAVDEQPVVSPGQASRRYNRYQDTLRGRSAEFEHGHDSAKPDRPLSGNYTPPVEQWDTESLRTVEDERERRLRE